MKKKTMMKVIDYLYRKQLFADGDGNDGGQDENGGQDGSGAQDEGQDKGEKKYSDEDLDRILGAKFAKWQKQQERKVSEAEKLAKMTEEEKAKKEMDDLRKEIADLKKSKALAEISKTARGILKDEGISVSDDLVSMLVSDDADATGAAVKAFATAFKAAVQDAVKAALKGHEPKGGAGGAGSDGWTKEKILAEKDTDKRQKLIREHLDLFR